MSIWQTEAVEIMRGLLFDFSDTPTYSDETLSRLLVIAAHYVVPEAGFSGYSVDISLQEISPDPAADETRDVNLINLTCLKAACMLDRGATRLAIAGGIMIKDDKATVDFRDKASKSLEILKQGYCAVYEQALLEYRVDQSSATAAAVLSPFRPDSYAAYGGYHTIFEFR